jgi:hypothetical protein
MVEYSLDRYQLMQAAMVGIMRKSENIEIGKGNSYNWRAEDKDSWDMHIEGAISEYVASKAFNKHWDGKGKAGDVDVGKRIEVRWSPEHSHRLIVQKSDKEESFYVFVTGSLGKYRVHGYINGANAKKAKYWSDPVGGRAAYFIPKEDLIPINGELN